MKRKLSFLISLILLVPLFALFGCEDVSSYSVSVFSSWINSGSVSGEGTYKDGETVTLTATALQDSQFVAWIFQDDQIVTNGDVYQISMNQDAVTNKVKSSQLSFVMSKELQGKYIAVFEEQKMMYTKLTSFTFTNRSSTDAIQGTLSGISIFNGSNSDAVYSSSELQVENGVENNLENDIKNTLLLSPTSAQPIMVDLTFTTADEVAPQIDLITLRGGISLRQNIEKVQNKTFDYTTTYSNGTYTLTFNFDYKDDVAQKTLTLVYKNLTVQNNQ